MLSKLQIQVLVDGLSQAGKMQRLEDGGKEKKALQDNKHCRLKTQHPTTL